MTLRFISINGSMRDDQASYFWRGLAFLQRV